MLSDEQQQREGPVHFQGSTHSSLQSLPVAAKDARYMLLLCYSSVAIEDWFQAIMYCQPSGGLDQGSVPLIVVLLFSFTPSFHP